MKTAGNAFFLIEAAILNLLEALGYGHVKLPTKIKTPAFQQRFHYLT